MIFWTVIAIGYLIVGIASPWLVRFFVNRAYTVDDGFEVIMWLFFWPVAWLVGTICWSCMSILDRIRELMP